MNGVLIVNKPTNMTSRDVVNILSKIFHTKKIGHAGTLDPMATGVLVICIGKYTKLVEILTGSEKTYEFEACLGIKTDTLDIEGKVIEEKPCILTSGDIDDAIQDFPHKYLQEVPIYSAVHVNGKKLYEYARNHETVTLPKREVEIYHLKRTGEVKLEHNHTYFKGEIKVSKGTFIRSFISDFASSLDTIGIMTSLKRIQQGKFLIENAYTLEQIEKGDYQFVDIQSCLQDYPIYEVDSETLKNIQNGALINKKYKEDIIAFSFQKKILAIYKTYEKDHSKMKPWKMF